MAKRKIKKDAVVLTSRDMLNGYVANNYDYGIQNMTPLQMIPVEEKDEEWKKWNLDWLERSGMRQLQKQGKKILKNYFLANGILDKTDYVISPENEFNDMINVIASDNGNIGLPIKFFPIIPNVINVLCGEHAKRDSRIIAKAVDETSINEAYEYKHKLITDILIKQAESKKMQQLQEMGINVNSQDPEVQQQVMQEVDLAKSIAEVEVKFKSYRGIAEQWANHMIQLDNDRFSMYTLEGKGFRDMLVADREFWHVKVTEDDYYPEVWEPWNTFYHKSPNVEYISEGNYVGRILLMSVPDVIDTYGHLMTEDQLLELKRQYRSFNSFPLVVDSLKDQANLYTDYSKPYPQSQTNVTWQKYMDSQAHKSWSNNQWNYTWDQLNQLGSSLDFDISGPGMVRVTDTYWKSQKRVGHLTKIGNDGVLVQDIVDETYIVTEKPIYDNSLNRASTKETLIKGEHIDWVWINEVRWGVKINSAASSTYMVKNNSDSEAIYIGGDPIQFQFKGQNNLYGCKLPVEGKVFSERGSYSSSLVDKMKPHQISFNIVNNQVIEYLADEIGNVLVLDQNMIPRNSLGGEWGKYAFPQFHQVMKDYQTAAIDPSIRNTESATNFAHFQTVDLSKTQQILTRMKLAEYFKNEAFSVVGITPQRLGDVSASESATGTQQGAQASHNQTEPYFDQHMNYLMPRVRQMMLDAAQFITSTKPSSRLTYLNSDEENVFFDIEGHKLLLRDFKIYAKSTANIKKLVDNLQQLAMQSQGQGGSLYDLAQMITLQSPSEIISKLRQSEDKRQQDIQAQRDHEQQLLQQQTQAAQELERQIEEKEDYWKERELQKEIYIAQIKALGYAKETDMDSNSIPDALEVDKFLQQQDIHNQDQLLKQRQLDMKASEMANKNSLEERKLKLQQEQIKSREKIEKMKLNNPVSGETIRKKK